MTRLPAPGRTLVMGILNVTPDSFSDGGQYLDVEAAVAHGLALFADGADLVDVGGESTRPGAQRASVETELARVLPVVGRLTAAGVPVSVDTMRAEVAVAAVAAGAVLVNLAPANPYSIAALATWRQGHFLNFNGLTRLTASLWPFLTLPYLMLLGRRL